MLWNLTRARMFLRYFCHPCDLQHRVLGSNYKIDQKSDNYPKNAWMCSNPRYLGALTQTRSRLLNPAQFKAMLYTEVCVFSISRGWSRGEIFESPFPYWHARVETFEQRVYARSFVERVGTRVCRNENVETEGAKRNVDNSGRRWKRGWRCRWWVTEGEERVGIWMDETRERGRVMGLEGERGSASLCVGK